MIKRGHTNNILDNIRQMPNVLHISFFPYSQTIHVMRVDESIFHGAARCYYLP